MPIITVVSLHFYRVYSPFYTSLSRISLLVFNSGGHRYSESNSVPVLDFKSSSVPVLGTHSKKYRITLAVLGTFFATLIKSKICTGLSIINNYMPKSVHCMYTFT